MASMIAQFLAPRAAAPASRLTRHAPAACHAACHAGQAALPRAPVSASRLGCRHAACSRSLVSMSAANTSEAATAEADVPGVPGAALEADPSEDIAAVADSALPHDEEDDDDSGAHDTSGQPSSRYPEFEETWATYVKVCCPHFLCAMHPALSGPGCPARLPLKHSDLVYADLLSQQLGCGDPRCLQLQGEQCFLPLLHCLRSCLFCCALSGPLLHITLLQ